MKAAFKRSPLDVVVRDVPTPKTGDDEIRIAVKACGVCGGDLSTSPEYERFGHEIAGEVVEIGRKVSGISVGDRVAIESTSYCGDCDRCRDGAVELCERRVPGSFAGFAEFVTVPARNAMRFDATGPRGLSYRQAGLLEPLGVALDLVYTADIRLGDHVLVYGAGSIGLMALAIARTMGAGRVDVAHHSRAARKISLARELGADDVILTDTERIADRKFDRGGVDKVLVTAPPETLPDAIGAAGFGGIVAFIGFSPDGSITFDANAFHVKKLQLRASFASPGIYFPTAAELLRKGIIDAERIVSHTFALDDIGGAMKTLATNRADVVKSMLLV